MYSATFREKVRRDFASGKYGSIRALAVAYAISKSIVQKWMQDEGWEREWKRRGKVAPETVEAPMPQEDPPMPEGESAVVAPTRPLVDEKALYSTLWKAVLAQAMAILKKNGVDKNGKLVPIDARDLTYVSASIERAQRGHMLVVGELDNGTRIIYEGLRTAVADAIRSNGQEVIDIVEPGADG